MTEGFLAGPDALLDQLAGQMKVKQPFEIPHEGDEPTRAARREIDDDIDKLERTILSLKTKRNELSPISILPTEVLSKIFILARDQSLEFQFHNHGASWIRVGHVCHHWREVALGCPSLWSVPIFTKPDLSKEMVQRSKMAALTIESATRFWGPRMLEELENAIAQIHRIQSIDIMLYDMEKLKTILSSFSQPAPLLEKFSLCDSSIDGNQFSFPTGALSDAPRLRSVEFARLNFSWESAVFRHRNLTDLRLSNNHAATDGTSTIGQMMDVLHHLPNLRILRLNDSIPSHMTSNGNEKTLEFKFLEYLELGAKAVDCIFLLRHIQYPPCTTIRVNSSSTIIEDSTTIFSLISQNSRRAQSTETGAPCSPVVTQSAQLMRSDSGTREITFYNKVDGTKHIPFGAPGSIINIRLGGDWTLGQAHGHLLTSLYNCFDLSSLQELLLNWSLTSSDIHAIQDTFGRLPKLETINMSESFSEMCLAIAESPKDSPAKRPEEAHYPSQRKLQHSFPPTTTFPALRTLIVEGIDFRQRRHSENMEHLVDMLIKRSDMNMPIDRLSLEECIGLRTWQKRRLGELVADLEIEGKVINVKELDSDDDGDGEDDYSDEDEDEDEGDYDDDDDFLGDMYY